MKFGQQQHLPQQQLPQHSTSGKSHSRSSRRQARPHGRGKKSQLRQRWLMRAALMAVTMPMGAPRFLKPLLTAARADVYHAVEPGETLRSIANHYGLRTDTLQAINHLENTKDTTPLPAMLLRVPTAKRADRADIRDGSVSGVTEALGASNLSALPAGTPSGTIAQAVRYTVQAGDTVASIAQRFTQSGYAVTADDILQKNHLRGEPKVGSSILVPQQSTTYRASARQLSPLREPTATTEHTPHLRLASAATTEDNQLPTVQVVPDNQPVYQSITENTRTEHTGAGRRGTVLASRGGYVPGGSREGVRVLPPDQDAPNTGAAPRPNPRVIQTPTQAAPVALAQVAQVSNAGAKIRRLPETSAATLYACAVGTELAVTKQNGIWSAVLMSDRSTGWVPTRYLKFTGAQVDITSQVVTGSAAWANRPNYQASGTYSGHYNGNCPMVIQALRWLGTPYVYGGEGRRGIDCSSLIQHSFSACGYRLPRTAAEQARIGQAVDAAHLQPGDRLYFSASGTRIDHTGLYMGNGQFVHASGRGRMVMVSNLFDAPHWNIFVCARR